MLTPERWLIVEDLFHEALACPPADRAAFVESRCAGDAEIRAELESLLAAEPEDAARVSLAAGIAADWLADQPAEHLAGRTIGGYRILSLLGAGGMGAVYLAEDLSLGRRVAMKLLPALLTADAGRLRLFTEEARAASSLNHPNILTVLGVGDVQGRRFIVTEFIDGETVRARIARGLVPVAEALAIAKQVAAALDVAHRAGIIHRDIKPENLMIRPDGYVKVLDFGLAKLADDGQRPPRLLARAGAVVGTLNYMAPEQAMGGVVDARADLYSLAVVLHEMLTGELPVGSNVALTDHAVARPQMVALQSILRRGLAPEPDARYRSARDMARDLDAAARHVFPRRSRVRRFAPVAAVLLIALAFVTAYRWRSLAPPAPRAVASLIVMPLEALGPDQAHLEVGMSDAIATRLGSVRQLRVPPSAAVKVNEDPFVAARRLGVDAVLTGSVQRAGDRLRVTVQLSHAVDRTQIWTAHFDERFTDIFAVQDAIAERTAASLLREVSASDHAALRRRETDNVEAYELYLRARERWRLRTPDSIQTAIRMYQDAIRHNPNFAAAYAGLADAYTTSAAGLPASTRYPLAKAAALKALALNPQLAEAHVALGFVSYKAEWKWEFADQEFQRAVALDPNYSLAHHQSGELHKLMGNTDQAIADFRRARALDPYLLHTRADLQALLVRVGQRSEARTLIEEGLKQDPNSWEMHQGLSEVLVAEGRIDESVDEDLTAKQLLGQPAGEVSALREAYRRGGRPAYWQKQNEFLLTRFRGNQRTVPTSAASALAFNFARLHDRDQTFHWLEVAAERGEEAPLYLRYPLFDFVRQDHRFIALSQRVFGKK